MGARPRAGGARGGSRAPRAVLLLAVAGLLAPITASPAHAANEHANEHAVCPAEPAAAHCHAHVVTDAHGNPAARPGPVGYGPAQFQAAYGLSSVVTPTSQPTITIVDAYDDPAIESDLATYSSQFGLPQCGAGCFTKVNQTGGTKYPPANAGWALEIALDVEVAHAVCPGCKILLVEAKSNSWADLLAAEDFAADYAKAHAGVVSNSWGASESSDEGLYDTHFNRPGVPITVSSGDNGYGVEYPAASPYVTAVGGTTLVRPSSPDQGWSELAWSGAGSGCSAYELKPDWQKDTGCAHRAVADVSADADPTTGAAVYDSFRYQGRAGWFQVGGTSLSAPLIAAVYALAGNGAQVDGSYPYGHTAGLRDVTVGSNGSCAGSYLCTAGTSYDGPTGLGTPQGTGAF